MAALTTMKNRLASRLRREGTSYAAGADRPLTGYSAALGTYAGLVGAAVAAACLRGLRPPETVPLTDIALNAVATHKLSRLLARDAVTSPLRAPFTTYQGPAGPAELHEAARGDSARKTVGELVTCPFCVGMWIATGLTAGLVYAPRATRLASATLTTLTGADLLHYGQTLLDKAAG